MAERTPPKTFEERSAMVGETVPSAEELLIEAGKVAEFASAIGADSSIYRDRTLAREQGFADVPAPLTFSRTAEFPRYRPSDFVEPNGFDLGFDPTTTLHGEQAYEYHAPVTVGDVLSATATLADVRLRTGARGGEMTFADIEQVFEDETGRRVLTVRSTYIETDGADELVGSERSDATQASTPDSGDDDVDSDADLTLVSDELDRTDFVRYAGASGDFTPLHFDEPYARSCGFESVFAQGMLTAGIASGLLTDRFGVGAVRRYRTRFEDLVFAGETLVVRGSIADERSAGDTSVIDVDVEAETSGGRRVLSGDATVEPTTTPPE